MTAMQPALRFRIDGMDCAEEIAALKREVAPVVGGESGAPPE
jgi:Zn2+/Cd2+-exporting ATPase